MCRDRHYACHCTLPPLLRQFPDGPRKISGHAMPRHTGKQGPRSKRLRRGEPRRDRRFGAASVRSPRCLPELTFSSPRSAQSGCRRGRRRRRPRRALRPDSAATSTPARRSTASRAGRSRTTRAGWALRAGRKSSSTPRCRATAPRTNQQPPRRLRFGLRDPLEPEQAGVERLGLGLAARWHGQLHVVQPHDLEAHCCLLASGATWQSAPRTASLPHDMGSLIKKRRKRMRKKKHKKMLKATRWQRRAGK